METAYIDFLLEESFFEQYQVPIVVISIFFIIQISFITREVYMNYKNKK